MANEFLWALVRINVIAIAAVLIVLALRHPVRRFFGARAAYALWAIVLCASAAGVLPPRTIVVTRNANVVAFPTLKEFPVTLKSDSSPAPKHRTPDIALLLIVAWVVGLAGTTGSLVMRQIRFRQSLGQLQPAHALECTYLSESTIHGPLVAGVLKPTIILPADFESRFSEAESALVVAHERTHLKYRDTYVNLLVAISQCLNWFNPFVHIAAFQIRLDQEIACDADVVSAYPEQRRTYAEAMLKNVLCPTDVPIGCAWPSQDTRPLKKRISLLNAPSPSKSARLAGVGIVALAAFASSCASWASQPPSTKIVEKPSQVGLAPLGVAPLPEIAWGDPQAKLTVVEYASLTCPHCAYFSNEVFPRIKASYIDSGKIRFVYRDASSDRLATGAALISRCATEDGSKTLIELMAKNLNEWTSSSEPLSMLKQYARQAGMTETDIDECVQNQALLTALNDQRNEARELYKVTATPTFLIGDERYEGVLHEPDRAYEALSEIIERQLRRSK